MGYEEVETVLPADFVPRPDPKPEPVMESLVKEADSVIEQEQDNETTDPSDLLAEVVYPSEAESEPEDAACGGIRRGRKKKKRMSLSSSKRSLSSSSKKSSTSATTPSSPANSKAGRKSMLSRWRSSRSKSRGRKKKGDSTGGDVGESESETEGKKKKKKGKSRSKSKSKLSFRTIRRVDSNGTEVVNNTTKKKKKELLEKAKQEAEPKEEEKEEEADLAVNTQLSTVREGSPANTTVTVISNSPGREKDAVSPSKAPINAPSPSITMASVSEFSIEVGDENEQVAIPMDSIFNKALIEGGTEKEAAGDVAGAEQMVRSATSGDMSVRSTRSTKSNRSVSSKASARSIKSKKSGESAAGDASVRSTKSNRSVRSTKSTSSKRSVKKSDSQTLVKASSQEVSNIKEESEVTAPVSADPSEEENGEVAESSEPSQKSKWVKKVSVSIGGYKTSFQFSDPMANLADAVNDALDVVGNGDDNLMQEAKGLDDINATSTEVDEVAEERDYDENPTRLFMYLQQRAWGLALPQLQSYPDEAKVWVYRKAKPEKAPNVKEADSKALVVQHNSLVVHDGNEQPKFRWKLLPLHAAIVLGAPTEIIQDIVRAYPNAAKKTDERGSLPVHLAASRLDVDPEGEKVVLQLFGAYPDSIEMQDRKGRTPPELAKLARARKDIEEQRKVNMTTSMASQVGQECTMSQHGREPSVASTNASEEDASGDDDRSVSSGISGRFKQMLFKSKSTDTVDRRKKNKKKGKKSSAEAELSSAKSLDGGDDEVEGKAPADDAAVADSLGPGFAFLTSSKSQEVRERAATDEDVTEESEAEREPTDAEILKSMKQAICISKEYQTPENAPGEVWDPMNIPLPPSFSMGDDESVRSMRSSRSNRSSRSSRSSRSKRASSSKSSSEPPEPAEEEISPTPFPRSGSCDSAKKLTRSGSVDSAKNIAHSESSDSAKKLSLSGSSDSAKTPEPPISQEESADSETKKAVTIMEEPSEVHETACQTVPDDTETNIEEEVKQPKPVQNQGLRVLLEKAVENAGRSGVDVTEFVQILEDEWVTDVEALRRLDGDTLDDLLPLMLSRELQRLINHADSIDNKFLKEDGGRGRSPKKSSKKKKKKRSYRKAKKRGHFRPVSPQEGPLSPISEEVDSPASMNSDDHMSIVTEARSVHSSRSAPPELQVPDEDDDEDDGDFPNNEEDDADDDSEEIVQSASIEDLEIRKLHANLIADARKKFPTREALEDSIMERQSEVEQAVNSGFDVDKQTLARAALADDEVRKLLPLRLILPTVTDLSEMIGVLQVHKEGAMRALNMDKARHIQSEIDELQDQINKEERYLLQKKMDETGAVKVSTEKVVGILRTKEKKPAASEKPTTKDVMTVDSRDDV